MSGARHRLTEGRLPSIKIFSARAGTERSKVGLLAIVKRPITHCAPLQKIPVQGFPAPALFFSRKRLGIMGIPKLESSCQQYGRHTAFVQMYGHDFASLPRGFVHSLALTKTLRARILCFVRLSFRSFAR